MSPLGTYGIDGLDWFGEYGVMVRSGSDALLKPPDSKPVFTHDWGDENGVEVDLSKRVFQPKTIPFEIFIVADTETQFWTQYNSLFTLLSSPGFRRVYVAEFKRSFFLYYDKCTGFNRLTRLLEVDNQIGMKGTLEFIEPVPSFWKRFTYLSDENGNHILTPDGKNILVT